MLLQGEIWCWSLLGLKGLLTWPILMLLVILEEAITFTYLQMFDILLCSELEIVGFLHEAKQWTSIYVNCLSQSTTPGHTQSRFHWLFLGIKCTRFQYFMMCTFPFQILSFGSLNKMCLGLWIQHLTSLMVVPFWDGNESQTAYYLQVFVQLNCILNKWQSSTIKKLQKLTKKTHAKITSMIHS